MPPFRRPPAPDLALVLTRPDSFRTIAPVTNQVMTALLAVATDTQTAGDERAGGAPPVGVGVAGLGAAGMYHLERLGLRDDFRIVAGFDDCGEVMRKAIPACPRVVETWQALLRDEGIELIVLATPPATHAALAIEALSAGKHVLVETPLCLNLVEADAILGAASRAARSVIVSQTRRFDDPFLAASECLRSGALGRLHTLKHIAWRYSPHGPPVIRDPSGACMDVGAELRPHHWRDHLSTGGGLLWESGVHLFDQSIRFAGLPRDVLAEPLRGTTGRGIDDGFLAVVRFHDGAQAHVEVHRGAPVDVQTGWILVGDLGTYANGRHYSVTGDGEVVDVPLPGVPRRADGFHAALFGHLRASTPNPAPVEEARGVIALIEAAHRSLRAGVRVAVEL
jgi:predicted dehydrogenase